MTGNRTTYLRAFLGRNCLLSGCTVLAIVVSATAVSRAQASFSLRGSIDEPVTAGETGNPNQEQADATAGDADSAYVPASPGALPESDVSPQPVPVIPPRLGDAAESPAARVSGASIPASGDEASMPPAGSRPLDLLDTGSVRPDPAVRAAPSQRENLRAGATGKRNPAPQGDPFAPPGIRLGNFVVRPSLEQGLRATDNADESAGGEGSLLSETTLRLSADSDWSRHALSFNGYLTAVKSVSGAQYSEPLAGFDTALRLDLDDNVNVNASVGYSLSRETGNDPASLASPSVPPLQQEIVAALGATRTAGKLVYNLTGGVDRQSYGDAELAGGSAVSQKDRNNTLLTATLRTGYEVTPALTPFAAAELGTRLYDRAADRNGYERSSILAGLRAGAKFDFGEKLNGEFSLGWLRESFDDPRLTPVTGPVALASVNWSPRRLTTVALNVSTTTEGSTTPGQSGSILYSADTTATRQLRADLSASATLGGYYRDYTGSGAHDLSYLVGVGFTYWLNPNLGLIGTLQRQQVYSTDPARDFAADSAYLGVRVQR